MQWATDKEKKFMQDYRDVLDDSIVNANEEGVLYVRDIRHKLHRAVAQAAEANSGLLSDVRDYMLDTYGVKLAIAEDGVNYLPTYEIADEQKYLFFMIKF